MLMEPNCILLGKTSLNDSFIVHVCDINNINGIEVLFDQLKISGLKYLIYDVIKKHINNDDYNDLNLWKADIAFGDKLKDLTEEQIANNCLIFVQVPVTAYTGKRKAEEEYGVIVPKRRFFASVNEAYPDFNFFIEPEVEVEKVVQLLLQRKFTLLLGHRQSGKSTTCHAILRWFRNHPEKIREAGFDPQELDIRIVTFDATVNTEEPTVFWESICKKLRNIDRKLFNFDPAEKCTSITFQGFFSKRYHFPPKQIILIFDDASRMSVSDDCTVEFIDSLWTLKGDRDNFCLLSVILIGTANIRDFLISHQSPGAMSKISPFSAEACLTCSRFTKAEVEGLFKQFATNTNESFDFINIASNVFDLTLGHKGLVGACGDYIQNTHSYSVNPIQTLDDWEKPTPMKLPNRIINMATYESIVRNLDTLTFSRRCILIKVLRFGTCQIDLSNDDAKFLLAEGMIFAKRELPNGFWEIEIAAPILRSLIISIIVLRLSIPNNPPNTKRLDPRWLLARTIENLCVRNLYSEETLNVNEYAFQSEFAIVFKNVLGHAYADLRYRVLVEAKEYVEGDTRRQRLDLLIRDGYELPAFGFELVVSASKTNFKNNLKRSQRYGKIHNCIMFMVNLCPKPTLGSYFGENDDQVEDNDEDEKAEEYEEHEEHEEIEKIAVKPVNVIIKKNAQEAWQGELKYRDGNSALVSIIDSKWNMFFNRTFMNIVYSKEN
ncbi:P-loop containing nucleoside triphosphate hydrolase protein [Rhizophagus clarus]|uniref:P-loop containing nucleoside triphosphate hydrolase protein n=1 Tax=Rhizophagus clarus TaxID=94130 RepID=A0A8H3QJS0_9GLOM|nr:P-loop containing nucleoside triphosphate hydrolase protein [Rhizophagus clarus]